MNLLGGLEKPQDLSPENTGQDIRMSELRLQRDSSGANTPPVILS